MATNIPTAAADEADALKKQMQGLGATSYEGENVADVAAGIMGKDSRLMQRADAAGRQFANQRGLLNSTLAGQAATSAALDYVVPMASQMADQNFRRRLQTDDFSFRGEQAGLDRTFQGEQSEAQRQWQTGESLAQRGWQTGESEAQRGWQSGESLAERDFKSGENLADRDFKGSQAELDRLHEQSLQDADRIFKASESALERDFKMTIADLEVSIEREKILSQQTISAWELTSREAINAANIEQADRANANSMVTNAFRDYQTSIQSIMSNPNLKATERSSQIAAAKSLLTTQIRYTQDLYSATFDWPADGWGSGSSGSDDDSSSSSNTLYRDRTAYSYRPEGNDSGDREGPDFGGGGYNESDPGEMANDW